MKATLLLLLLPLALPGDPDSLPAGTVALLQGERVTLAEYKDFLYLTLAQSRLEDLLEFKLLRREARRLGVDLKPAEVARLAEAERTTLLRKRFGGDARRLTRSMLGRGYSLPEMQRWLAFDLERRLLQDRIIRATRTPTPDRVQRKFEELYGVGGVRLRLRHIQVSLAPLVQAALKRVGSMDAVDRKALERAALERARAIRARLDRGEDFAGVCVETSDEPAARAARGRPADQARAGRIPNYNYRRFGPAFAQAVRALKVGGVAGPIPFRSEGNLISYHLVRLDARETTRLEPVREQVVAALRAEPIGFYDRIRLKNRLLGSAGVRTRSTGKGDGKGTR